MVITGKEGAQGPRTPITSRDGPDGRTSYMRMALEFTPFSIRSIAPSSQGVSAHQYGPIYGRNTTIGCNCQIAAEFSFSNQSYVGVAAPSIDRRASGPHFSRGAGARRSRRDVSGGRPPRGRRRRCCPSVNLSIMNCWRRAREIAPHCNGVSEGKVVWAVAARAWRAARNPVFCPGWGFWRHGWEVCRAPEIESRLLRHRG